VVNNIFKLEISNATNKTCFEYLLTAFCQSAVRVAARISVGSWLECLGAGCGHGVVSPVPLRPRETFLSDGGARHRFLIQSLKSSAALMEDVLYTIFA
jgi:hypothetical protein